MQPYWGEYDSSVIFCEDKYANSHFIAEYYNTLSGLFYFFIALYFFTTKMKKYAYLISSVSIGTIALHGTLRWYGQWIDEMAMLTLMFFYIKDVYYDLKYIYCAMMLGFYMTFHDNYNVFLFLFIFIVIYQYNTVQLIINDEKTRYYLKMYKLSMMIGFTFWLLDRLCFTKIINFHVLWHILSGIGAYNGTQVYHEHRKQLDKAGLKIVKWMKTKKLRNKEIKN